MNQQQAELIVKLRLTDEQIKVMFPSVAPRHYGLVREWGTKGGEIQFSRALPEYSEVTADPQFAEYFNYRLAPRTVTITGPGGTFEIPEPVREPLEIGQVYWEAQAVSVHRFVWENDKIDMRLLAQGRIHLTEKAAQAHADALAKLMQKEVKS